MTKNLELEPSEWQPCPPGEFQRAQQKIALREKRSMIAQWSGVVVCAVVLFAVGVQARSTALDQRSGPLAGGITCEQIHQMATDGSLETLDAATRAKISMHLSQCRECRMHPPAQLADLKTHNDKLSSGESCNISPKSHCD